MAGIRSTVLVFFTVTTVPNSLVNTASPGVMASPPMVALMVSGVVLPSRNLACLSMALNSASFRVLALVSVAA